MLVIYGSRQYGKAAAIDDEYAVTRWFHIYFVPLIPVSSHWVANGAQIEIGLHGRSVGTIYARLAALLGIIVGLVLLGDRSAAGIFALAPAIALGWLSLRWRTATAHEKARAKFHRAIYGRACPPAWLPPAVRATLREQLDAQWPAVGGGRTPEDVARDGARSGPEAAAAYMILTLAGATREADRIVAGEVAPSELGGPYRGVEYRKQG